MPHLLKPILRLLHATYSPIVPVRLFRDEWKIPNLSKGYEIVLEARLVARLVTLWV